MNPATQDEARRRAPSVLSQYAAQIDRVQQDPVFFAEKWLGITGLYDKQVEFLESIRDHRRTSVRACHSSGKTFGMSIACWWVALGFPPSKVITTAPGLRQTKDLLWAEIRARHARAKIKLPGECLQLEWKMPDLPGKKGINANWYMLGFATSPDQMDEHASRFTGYHAPHVLVVFDEASGIDMPIWKAADGLLASGRWVRIAAIGNPMDASSMFAETVRSPAWNSIQISAFDTPNFREDIPDNEHLVTTEWVEELREIEGEDSPLYMAKVDGEFPDVGEDTLIPLGWVSRAMRREGDILDTSKVGIGVDVARFGSDATAIYVVRAGMILHAEGRPGLRSTWTGRRVAELAKKFGMRKSEAFRISVDGSGGYGSGVVDTLVDLGWDVNEILFGSSAIDEDRFADRRTELWWHLREWIEVEATLEGCPVRARKKLEGDLTTPKYDFERKKLRRILEQKKDMKKRLGRSPDDGDALALAIAWRHSRREGLPVDADVFDEDLEDDERGGVDPFLRDEAPDEMEAFLDRRARRTQTFLDQ